ncbi:MAG: hypothetical protein ACLPWS_12670 [Rhodomicrobium sp.]
MLIQVRDAQGNLQLVAIQSVAAPTDRSGSITATGSSQQVMAANALRSGWYFQNTSTNPMTLNDLGADATQPNSFVIGAGQFFPPPRYPVSQGAITVAGLQAGDTFVAREW